jgi:hypothetical protein
MKDIQKRELIRSVKLIQSLGCSFRILSPDGDSFGDLQIVEPKVKNTRGPSKYAYGALTEHVRKHINLDIPIGEVQELPCGDFELELLRASACVIFTRTWGKENYVTAGRGDHIEVLRKAEQLTEETA